MYMDVQGGHERSALVSTSYNAINQCLTVSERIKSVDNDPSYLV